jgi:hypothetical protein
VFGAPGALQGLGNVVRIVGAVRVAQLCEVLRVALARYKGFEDGHAGRARDVTDDLGEFEVHLLQGLLHVLNMLGGRGEQHLAVTQVATQHAHLGVWTEGPGEQPVGVQALQPLAIEPISLGPSRSALGLTRIDQEDLHPTGFQEFKEGNPVNAGRFHGDSGHTAVNEPVGQGVEVGGAGAETAHGLRVAPRGHGHPVLGFTDVDTGGVGVANLECIGEHGPR